MGQHNHKSKWYVLGLAVLSAMSLSALFFTGCSSNAVSSTPKDPIDLKLQWLDDNGPTEAKSAPGLGFAATVDTVVTATIDSEGGKIKLRLDESKVATVNVPKGAVAAATNFSFHVQQFETPVGTITLLDCGPDGSVFAVPLIVSFPVDKDQKSAALYYFNEAKGAWEVLQVAPASDGAAQLNIYHFSKYGIG